MAANAPTALCPASRERSAETARGVTHPRGISTLARGVIEGVGRPQPVPGEHGEPYSCRPGRGSPRGDQLRLLPARVPISMRWLKTPRISPLRRMRRQGHTARVVIGVYSAASNLSGSCLGCRDGGTTARARRASDSHTRGRSAGIRSRRAGVGSSSRSSGRSRKPTDVPSRHRIITSGLIHSASSRTSLGPCSAERSSVRAVTGKSTTDRRPAATSAA